MLVSSVVALFVFTSITGCSPSASDYVIEEWSCGV
jgi:hypothetical protein